MNLRFGVGLCVVVVGLSGLTLCQPPRPRIARVTGLPVSAIDSVEAKGTVTDSSRTERVAKEKNLDGPLSSLVIRPRDQLAGKAIMP